MYYSIKRESFLECKKFKTQNPRPPIIAWKIIGKLRRKIFNEFQSADECQSIIKWIIKKIFLTFSKSTHKSDLRLRCAK